MCCNANRCCCGCIGMKTGITIAGIIDLLILLAAAAAIAVVIGYHGGLLFMIYIANSNYIFVMVVLIAWFGILVTSDILLIVGVGGNNTGLMMVWLITGMINIVFLLTIWASVFLFFAYTSCSECWSLLLDIFLGNDTTLAEGNNRRNRDKDEFSQLREDENGFYQLAIILWLSYTLIIVVPIYYIYLWVIVKCHLENIIKRQMAVVPLLTQQPIAQPPDMSNQTTA